jgi:DNA-binding XRE family transcriptional regulator
MHQRVSEGPGEEMAGSADSTRHWPAVALASELNDHVFVGARVGGVAGASVVASGWLAAPAPPGSVGRGIPARRRSKTQIRHAALRVAVRDLRKRIGWTQDDLAAALDKHLGKKRVTRQSTISKWEVGIDGPSPSHRMVLAKIASKYEHEDLAAIFRNVAAPHSEEPSDSAQRF